MILENGKIIRGVIIEQIPNKSLKIQTADLSVFQFTLDEIDKITKEIIPSSKSNTSYLDNYPNNKPLEYKIPYDIIDRGVSKVLATKEFFWFGIDFALAKYTDPNKLDDANILINTFCPAWSKYFDEKFTHKKKERLFNVNLLLDRTDEIQLVNYLKINENDFMLTKPFSLSIKEIETQVKNYQLKEQSGIGQKIIVH